MRDTPVVEHSSTSISHAGPYARRAGMDAIGSHHGEARAANPRFQQKAHPLSGILGREAREGCASADARTR